MGERKMYCLFNTAPLLCTRCVPGAGYCREQSRPSPWVSEPTGNYYATLLCVARGKYSVWWGIPSAQVWKILSSCRIEDFSVYS